jgi:hypothetical protein
VPLQNRVNPFGEIVATASRGTMMGNRGGKFHRDDRTLGKRRWATRHWICCDMYYKNKQHEAMGPYYTSLFFLDEVTALSAGHRPCFYCRNKDATRFLSLAEPLATPMLEPLAQPPADLSLSRAGRISADTADRIADVQRRSHQPDRPVDGLPDGTMVAVGDLAYAVRGGHLLRWSFDGYVEAVPRASVPVARPLTPPLYVGILARGFEPQWHDSATPYHGMVAM